MKKVFGLFWGIMLLLTILPSQAHAAENYGIFVNGEEFSSEHTVINCGEGTATLDVSLPEAYVLTLDNCTINAGPVKADNFSGEAKPLIINIKGGNVIDCDYSSEGIVVLGSPFSLAGIGDDASLLVNVRNSGEFWTEIFSFDNTMTIRNLKLRVFTDVAECSSVFTRSIVVDNATIECKASMVMLNEDHTLSLVTDNCDYEVLVSTDMAGTNPVNWAPKDVSDDYKSMSLCDCKYMSITPVSGSISDMSDEEDDTDTNTTIPQGGDVIVSDTEKAVYKVTEVGDYSGKVGKVTYVSSTDKSASSITIRSTVTIDGIMYKVTAIASEAFKGNKKLEKLVVGKEIKTIGKAAFYGCTKLESVELQGAYKIRDKAFSKCSKLTKMVINSTKLKSGTVGEKVFTKINSKAVIKVNAKKVSSYKKLFKKAGLTGSSQTVKSK